MVAISPSCCIRERADFVILFILFQLQRKALDLATTLEPQLKDNHEITHWLTRDLKEVKNSLTPLSLCSLL